MFRHPLAAAILAAIGSAIFARGEARSVRPESEWMKPTIGGSRYGNRSGRSYPEQSHRQRMRKFRRAQGGPGLDENDQPRSS